MSQHFQPGPPPQQHGSWLQTGDRIPPRQANTDTTDTFSPAAMESTRRTLMSPKSLRVMVCAADGSCSMSDGIPPGVYDIRAPAYDSLCTEPLLVPDHKKAPPCFCEYIVVREGSAEAAASKPANQAFRRIAGSFFVLKFVTSKPTMNRIQIEVAQSDQSVIVRALRTKYT